MKKLICHLLIVWLALVSGGTNALSAYDAAHETEHAAHVRTASGDTSNGTNIADAADNNHAESCHHGHCGHGHTIGLLMPMGVSHRVGTAVVRPSLRSRWASATTANNIERPKWPVTTPAVVSLLA